ncbi:MAG: YebC/PmpR family DNA-binding transcriptional regulator [Anaerovoracaceae bacterium]|jgi:YebC/PmpR family DNA-binding regulatory protein|nr:YebC/PmpR family DNA-binding transcriptional regulator [Bacillota bacterium]MDY2671404.1 YebC/PmpR family DNA-binding transcriptional regulator [Anaerovoracaceae bacterium]
MGRHGTIAGRKAAQDAKRSANFTKYARVITIAAKQGGDPDYNVSLKHAIERAKGINMPNDKIERAIKKGTGELEGESYVEESFEGYGPGGVAMIVDVVTDNKNRTTSFVKHSFDRHNGNLGKPGSVSYMFERKGVIEIEKADGIDEDALMEVGMEAGMDDMVTEEDGYVIYTTADDFDAVQEAIEAAGYAIANAEVDYLPSMESKPESESDLKSLKKLVADLEENDDVQKVTTNCSIDLSE